MPDIRTIPTVCIFPSHSLQLHLPTPRISQGCSSFGPCSRRASCADSIDSTKSLPHDAARHCYLTVCPACPSPTPAPTRTNSPASGRGPRLCPSLVCGSEPNRRLWRLARLVAAVPLSCWRRLFACLSFLVLLLRLSSCSNAGDGAYGVTCVCLFDISRFSNVCVQCPAVLLARSASLSRLFPKH